METFPRRAFLKNGSAGLLLALTQPLASACADPGSDKQEGARGPGAAVARLMPSVQSAMEATKTPGLAFAAFDRDGISAAGLGLLRSGSAEGVTERTVFPAASLSKPTFAFIVMTLAQQRRLGSPAPFGSFDLDAPLGSFGSLSEAHPPGLAADDPRMRRVTPRMMLEHTHAIGWRWEGAADDPARTGTPYMTGEPGRTFDYAPQGYAYLQGLIEHLTGKGLEALAHERLFGPLGMWESSFLWQPRFAGRIANGHDEDGRPSDPPSDTWSALTPAQQQRLLRIGLGPASATASLRTTAPDYARFMRGLLLGLSGDGKSPLSPHWTREMLTPHVSITDRIGWGPGFGFVRDGTRQLCWHYGHLGDYQSFVFADPGTASGLVFLTNSANGLRACRKIFAATEPALTAVFDWLEVA